MQRHVGRELLAVASLPLGLVQLACGRTGSSTSRDAAIGDSRGRDFAQTEDLVWFPEVPRSEQPNADSRPDLSPEDLSGLADVSAARDQVGPDAFDAPSAIDGTVADVAIVRQDGPVGDTPGSDGVVRDASDAGSPPSDGLADRPDPCGPGGGGCNDDPRVSSIWGTCQPDGTCACRPGLVINPATGRCRPPLQDASPSDDAVALACSGEYSACGCGCCGDPRNVACYYPTLGETTAAIKAQDEEAKNNTNCNLVGCNAGIRYVCCLPAEPDPASGATYTADAYLGDMYHVTISKSGAGCAQLSLSSPAKSTANYRIDTPASWGVMWASFGPCGIDAGVLDSVGSGLGEVVLRASDTQCLVDVHVTLFSITSDRYVKTTRLDVDGLVVADFPASLCK